MKLGGGQFRSTRELGGGSYNEYTLYKHMKLSKNKKTLFKKGKKDEVMLGDMRLTDALGHVFCS